ncbi:MAG TPA: SRPBCC domain-containing protein [Chryseolinea sp.]
MSKIYHELIIGASAEQVYNAIVRQDGLTGWWTPDVTGGMEVNGIVRFGFGPTYFKEMKVAVLKPFQEVKWICLAGANEWIGTTLTFRISSGDKQSLLKSNSEAGDQIQQQSGDYMTLLKLEHDGWKEYSPMFAECNYTWGRFLRSLKLFCETGKGIPWPNQHRVRA